MGASPPVSLGPATGLHCPYVNGLVTPTQNLTIVTSAGTIVAQICSAEVPETAAHFLGLAQNATYVSAATIYRAVPGFVIQGGIQFNPSAFANATLVPVDEFHPDLRHNSAGVLSEAHAGPHTGRSEWFITLAPTTSLDDRHEPFGYVTYGMKVVYAIGNMTTNKSPQSNGALIHPITILSMSVAPTKPTPATVGRIAAYAPLAVRNGSPQLGTQWAVVVQNEGNTPDTPTMTVSAPAGWATAAQPTPAPIPAGTAGVYLARVQPPANTSGTFVINATVTSSVDPSSHVTVPLTLKVGPQGETVVTGMRVYVDYVGMLTDGRLFDTSMASVARNASYLKLLSPLYAQGAPANDSRGNFPGYPNGYPANYVPFFRLRANYTGFNFTVGCNTVIAGFGALVDGAKIGEARTGIIPYQDAYQTVPGAAGANVYANPLVGKDLVFEVVVDRVCPTTNATAPC
ncbi:MAG: peptidylprolyl isomerase [Thermoplasmatota archaeon]